MDLDTCGGGIAITRLMGSDVRVSAEDTARSAAGAGSVRVGAVYADALALTSGTRAQLVWSHAPGAAPSSASCKPVNHT